MVAQEMNHSPLEEQPVLQSHIQPPTLFVVVVVVAVGISSLRKCPWGLRRMRATQDHNSSEREERRSKAWVRSLAELGSEWGMRGRQ